MPLDTFSSGIADPQPTPPRPAGSIRRTSHIDITFVAGELRLAGACRDLFTGVTPVVGREAAIVADLGEDRQLVALTARGGEVDVDQLLGMSVRSGFRARLSSALPAPETGSPLFVLLDELPVAALISGYAQLYDNQHRDQSGAADHMADGCSGWRSEGLMIRSIKATGRMPVPLGPPAPPPETVDDLAWHHLPPIPIGGMRRRRLIDVTAVVDGSHQVFATFRDTHVNDDGVERVLHEYTLSAAVGSDMRITRCEATPRVLPWNECPHAAASASRLVGVRPSEIRLIMRGVRGLGTCTHLNDLLRSLGDLEVLIGARNDADVTDSHA